MYTIGADKFSVCTGHSGHSGHLVVVGLGQCVHHLWTDVEGCPHIPGQVAISDTARHWHADLGVGVEGQLQHTILRLLEKVIVIWTWSYQNTL